MPRPYTRAGAPANVPRSHAVVPAKAGTHLATGRAADQWVPAFAGTRLGVAKAKSFNEDWSSFPRERRDHAGFQDLGSQRAGLGVRLAGECGRTVQAAHRLGGGGGGFHDTDVR